MERAEIDKYLLENAIFNSNPEFLAAIHVLSGLCAINNDKSGLVKVHEARDMAKILVESFKDE